MTTHFRGTNPCERHYYREGVNVVCASIFTPQYLQIIVQNEQAKPQYYRQTNKKSVCILMLNYKSNPTPALRDKDQSRASRLVVLSCDAQLGHKLRKWGLVSDLAHIARALQVPI